MKVCIAEKPSVAKEIASVLGAKSRKDGYFEGNGYQVTWTFGHLCTLKEPQDYTPSLKRWNIHALPILPSRFGIKLISNKGVSKQFNTIKQLITRASEVINCGDAGQEGELIQRWVLQKAGCKVAIKRLWISSLTEETIREGFNNLKDNRDFDRLYYAGSCRAVGDWLLGINATRLYTLKYGDNGTVLSIGRVQTPTLAMIVQRQHEIDHFTPEPFWELKTAYREATFSYTKGRFYEQEKANTLFEKIKEAPFVIVSFDRKKGKESAPKLFDLTSLQVTCNKKLNLSADETLKIAQRLYEKKYITYPRVDTRYLPHDQYSKIKGILHALKDYQMLTAPLLDKPIRKSKNVFNDTKVTDHHAIIPTNITANQLSHQEKGVYNMIVKRFLANFYPDCIVSRTTVLGETASLPFKATGKQILTPGWREVYGKEKQEDDQKSDDGEDNQVLPEFEKGETGPHDPFLKEKITKPPKAFTEATLLRAMETAGKQVDNEELRDIMKENGIGRPSTRANIIETLFRRKYIQKQRKSLSPTPTGTQLINTIQNDLLKSAELTGNWEKRLREIESGTYEAKTFMEEMKTMVGAIVKEVKQTHSSKRIAPIAAQKPASAAGQKPHPPVPPKHKQPQKVEGLTCPRCRKGQLLKGNAAYGCSRFREGCTFTLPFVLHDKKLTTNQSVSIITKGKSPLIKSISIDGEQCDGNFILDKDAVPQFKPVEKPPLKCPRCKQGEMIKGNSAYGCSRFRSGCHTTIPFTFKGKQLTKAQIESIIRKGRTSLIKGFVNQAGESIKGRVVLNKNLGLELVAQ